MFEREEKKRVYSKKGWLKEIKRQRLEKLKEIRNRQSQGSDPFFHSEEWRRLRYRVICKHGGSCSACGASGLNIKIHVDHIKPRSFFPELKLEESNLQVLCEACNIGKVYWDQTNWTTN